MQVQERGTSLVISLQEDQCTQLWKLVEPWWKQGKRSVVLDFSQVHFLNSINIAAIIALRNRVHDGGGRLEVAAISDRIKAIFRVLKLEQLFKLDQSLDEALRSLGA